MTNAEQIDAARRAKEALKAKYEDNDWYRGVGIVPTRLGLALRLNVCSAAAAKNEQLVTECEGFPVEVVVIEQYHKRE